MFMCGATVDYGLELWWKSSGSLTCVAVKFSIETYIYIWYQCQVDTMLATRKLTWQCVSYDWTLCVCQWPLFLAVAWDYPKVSKSNRPGPRAPTFSRIVAAVDCTRFQQGVQDSGGWSLLTSPSKESWEGFWELLGCVPGSWYKMNAAFSSETSQHWQLRSQVPGKTCRSWRFSFTLPPLLVQVLQQSRSWPPLLRVYVLE